MTDAVLEKQMEYSQQNDPLYKDIDSKKKERIDKAVEKHVRSLTLEENVDKDSTKVPGQNYALISIVSSKLNQKSDNVCIKIKGVFNTLEEANKHANILQKIDSVFDIYVVEMYSWLLVPPDPELLEQKHVDKKLNELIGGHRESQLKAKAYYDERKRDLLENINIENVEEEENEENTSSTPSVINADSGNPESRIDGNCPNSGPDTEKSVTPIDLMESMLNETSHEDTKKLLCKKKYNYIIKNYVINFKN